MEVATHKKVRAGCKATELGVIPEDWNVDIIDNHTHVTTGARNTQDAVADGKYPFFVRSHTVERINSYSFDGEAVLTAGDGVHTGKIFHYINGKFDYHQRVYKLSDFSNDLDGHFFYHYFSNTFYARIMQMTAKSSVDSVRREMITKMAIALPPLPEQKAIAIALSDIDCYIESLSRLIEKKKNIKTATMQQLLTSKRRLPGFSGEWKEDVMGKFGTCIRGVTYNSETDLHANRSSRTITLLRANNIKNELINTNEVQFVSSAKVKAEQVMVPGDIMICMANGSKDLVGKAGLYKAGKERNTFGSFMSVFRVNNNDLVADYTYYLLQTYSFRKHIANVLAGSSINNLRPSNIENFQILLPPKEEQEEIVSVLNDQHNEIFKLTAELEKITKIKYGMMNELLTGNIRLV